jgi:hypothetical protein
MPENLTPQNQWETQFEVPLPGEPRNIGPLKTLFQRLLNRTQWLNSNFSAHRTAATLDHPDGSVTTAKLANGAINMAKLASSILGQPNGIPYLDGSGAFAASNAYLDRGSINFDSVNWNTLTATGIYSIVNAGSGGSNQPPASYKWGVLLVTQRTGNDYIVQLYFPHSNDPFIYYRVWYETGWAPWKRAGVLYGSNSNGSYVRLPDGTQICWASHSDASYGSTITNTINTYVVYKFRTKTWTFPAAFTSAPTVLHNGDVSETTGFPETFGVYNVNTSQCQLEAGQVGSASNPQIAASFTIAIGRWV